MADNSQDQTYYEILELTPDAGPMEIYQAYQRAKSTYSPTSPALYTMFTPQEAQELMALIEEAYQTLSNQSKRRNYDIQMGYAEGPKPPEEVPKTVRAKAENLESSWIGAVKIMRKKDELPHGFARTKFSVYEINAEIEEEIGNVQECDGLFIQKIRLYKGVNLEQLSEEIRVTKSTLIALESNDIDALPLPVFTRGFIIHTARVLGVDEKQLADAYMKYFKARKVVP